MRIATYNLENLGLANRKAAPIEARIAVLRPQLERLAADIICLQEVNADRSPRATERALLALDKLIAGTGYQDFECVHSVDPSTQRLADKHNLVLLSRWPIEQTRQVWHDHVPPLSYSPVTRDAATKVPELVNWDRPLLHAAIRLPDGSLLQVINLHMRAPLAVPLRGQKLGPFIWKNASAWAEGFYIAMLKRSGQALEARIVIDQLFNADPDALILVCGDFNAAEREVPARIIGAGVDDTGNGALADRALVYLERAIPQSQRFSVIHHGEKIMLDHILISHNLLAHYRHFEVHNELLGDELFGYVAIAENPESYHAPVVAEFDI